MTQAVIAEVSATSRIVRLEPPRAVSYHARRRLDDALPHAPTIKLNRHSVRSINCALVPILHPNMAWIIDPPARRLTNFVDEIELKTVLGDVSHSRPYAILNALVFTGKKHLGRSRRDSQSTQCYQYCCHFHVTFSDNEAKARGWSGIFVQLNQSVKLSSLLGIPILVATIDLGRERRDIEVELHGLEPPVVVNFHRKKQ